jgi:putative ABC transport system permease protein
MSGRLAMRVPVTGEMSGPVQSAICSVTPGYFSTMKIPFVAGGDFPDHGARHPLAIITQSLARRVWGTAWVQGGRLRISDDPDEPWFEVIGVVNDVRSLGPETDAPPTIYVPHWQSAWPVMSLAIRTHVEPLALARAVREQVRAVDPSVPVFRVQSMDQIAAAMLATRRASMFVLGLFSACAMLLAAMGVYGVTAYLVGLRLREFGIRLALGARRSQVLAGVLRGCMLEAAIAAVVGTTGALALGRVLESFLVNVAPTDPVVLGTTCVALVLIAVASGVVPARRAASVDPAVTLRVE